MKTSLAGKVALVAGATRGAGRGIAVQLGAAGATSGGLVVEVTDGTAAIADAFAT
jgi:NAD(P)-dependent dehydrogenase (short-subunit alcohol dehydrogenase family)